MPYFWVISTELETFWQDFEAKALLLVILTELEIFWHDFGANALLLVISTELSRNILTRCWGRSPTMKDKLDHKKFFPRCFFLLLDIPTELEISKSKRKHLRKNFWWSNLSFIVDILNCQESFSQNYSNRNDREELAWKSWLDK